MAQVGDDPGALLVYYIFIWGVGASVLFDPLRANDVKVRKLHVVPTAVTGRMDSLPEEVFGNRV